MIICKVKVEKKNEQNSNTIIIWNYYKYKQASMSNSLNLLDGYDREKFIASYFTHAFT